MAMTSKEALAIARSPGVLGGVYDRGYYLVKQVHDDALASFTRAKWQAVVARSTDPSRYPHICPRCNGPAYVGVVEMDCSRGCK